MISINGNALCGLEGAALAAALDAQGFDKTRVVVERNGGIVARDSYDAIVLEDGDTLEVLQFVGGG